MPLQLVLVKVENQRGQDQRYDRRREQRRFKHQPGSPYSQLPSRQKLFHFFYCFVFVLQVYGIRLGPSRRSNRRVGLGLFRAFFQQRNCYKVREIQVDPMTVSERSCLTHFAVCVA